MKFDDISAAFSETCLVFECHVLMLLLIVSCGAMACILLKFHIRLDLVFAQDTQMLPVGPNLLWKTSASLVVCMLAHLLCSLLPGPFSAAAFTLPVILYPLLVDDDMVPWADGALCFDHNLSLTIAPMVLPYLLRFYQCIKEKNIISYLNAGKYVAALLFVVLHALYSHSEVWEVAFMRVAAMSSLFSFTWDILFDWDMIGRWNNPRLFPYNNTHVMLRVGFYSWCILSDFIMRFAWYFEKIGPHNYWVISFAYAIVEICRRSQWILLRLEMASVAAEPSPNLGQSLLVASTNDQSV